MKEINFIICGVGGQGNLLVEKILGVSAIKEGYSVRAADTFGAAQRGGSVLSHLRFGSEISSSLVPQGKCHVLIGMEPGEALNSTPKYLCKNGLVIVNTHPFLPATVKMGERSYPSIKAILDLLQKVTENVIDVDATTLAKKTAGTDRSMNVVLTGVLMGAEVVPLKSDTVREVIEQLTGKFAQANIRAFEAGYEVGKKRRGIHLADCQ